ncbi:MAG: CHASE3 domain-containing protein [Granulosicoccus sp.]|nr:CHASE3 domain-containing protein [Granulosicoccus sp.]
MSTLIYLSLNQLRSAFRWVEHTHVAINYGDSLLAAMIDMETGLRGYLIAGDAVFLEPYDEGQRDFEQTMVIAKNHVSDNREQVKRLAAIQSLKNTWLVEHAAPAIELRQEVNNAPGDGGQVQNSDAKSIQDVAAFIGRGLGKKSIDELRTVIHDFTEAERVLIKSRSAQMEEVSKMMSFFAIFGAVIAVLGSFLIVVFITRHISKQLGTEPADIEKIASTIAEGDLTQSISTNNKASGVLAAMQTMQANLIQRERKDRHYADEMARVKQALDNASSAVLVTDSELKIIYQNKSAADLFMQLEPEIKSACSNFSAAGLVGQTFCQFSTPDGISISELEQLSSMLKKDIRYGEATLRLVCSPINDESGQRLGIVAEWVDRTKRLEVENEIQAVVDSALVGDLSRRLPLAGKNGFFLMLGESMNSLVQMCESVVDDTVRVFGALSRYDLTETITSDYQGSYSQVKENANRTVGQLTNLIGKVKSDASMLDQAAGELNQQNERMSGTAEVSSDQANNVSAAIEQISSSINGVASASTEMSSSINEIARNAADATKIASEAVQLAESTEHTVRQLSVSSNDIGNVIKVINSIAEQTNLLALNATIEAARAGEAGKGFAVVANEVKDLAKETAKATEEIGQKIATIQTDSERAVSAIGGIDTTIQKINEIQGMIAAAVQEQTATTNEISRSVNEAAGGSREIADSSALAADGAMQALNSSNEARQSTQELNKLASELRDLVEQFRVNAA